MVALGSEIDENAGIRSFLIEHAQELRGAIIVDIEGLGAGELSLLWRVCISIPFRQGLLIP